MISVGASAPDFELPDQHGSPTRLSALEGSPVVVVFFPFAFTGVCTGELAALRDDVVPHLGDTAHVLAISCDSMFALRVFGETNGLDLPLLSDFWPHGQVTSSYGVFDADRGCALRGTFVVDAAGVVRWKVVNDLPDARNVADYRRVLADIGAA